MNKGAPAILARYLREHNGGDRLIVFISNMIDPSSNSPIQLVPKYRRGKGRPSKSEIRKAIESAIDEVRVAEKMRGDPIGTRGPTKRAIEEVKEETKRSVRTIKRHLALRKKLNRALFGTKFSWPSRPLSHIPSFECGFIPHDTME